MAKRVLASSFNQITKEIFVGAKRAEPKNFLGCLIVLTRRLAHCLVNQNPSEKGQTEKMDASARNEIHVAFRLGALHLVIVAPVSANLGRCQVIEYGQRSPCGDAALGMQMAQIRREPGVRFLRVVHVDGDEEEAEKVHADVVH